jgi:hypothetical protein
MDGGRHHNLAIEDRLRNTGEITCFADAVILGKTLPWGGV